MFNAEIIVMPTKNHNMGNKLLRIYCLEKKPFMKDDLWASPNNV